MADEFVISGRPPLAGYVDSNDTWTRIVFTSNSTSDVFDYYNGSSIARTTTINYSDSTKGTITTIVKS